MNDNDDFFVITVEHFMGDEVEIVSSASTGPTIQEVAAAVRRVLLGATFHPDLVDCHIKTTWSMGPEDTDDTDWQELV